MVVIANSIAITRGPSLDYLNHDESGLARDPLFVSTHLYELTVSNESLVERENEVEELRIQE